MSRGAPLSQTTGLRRKVAPALANPAFPSLYAWAVSVALPSLDEGVGAAPRSVAVLALGAAVAAGLLIGRSPLWSRLLGIYGFVGLSVVCWLLLGSAPLSVSSGRSILGGLGWAAFAVGWGAVRRLGSVPEEHPAVVRGGALEAHGTPPWRGTVAVGLALVGAALCMVLPWRIERMPHAALGHLAGLAAAGSLLIVAGRLSGLPHTPHHRAAAGTRLRGAAVPLGLLVLLLSVGLGWLWFSSG